MMFSKHMTSQSSFGRMLSSRSAVFDRALKVRQRDRAARSLDAASFDYIRDEVARRLVDRIEDIQREFPTMLDVGCHGGHVYAAVVDQEGLGGSGGIGGVTSVVQGDASEAAARRAMQSAGSHSHRSRATCHTVSSCTLPSRSRQPIMWGICCFCVFR